MGSSAERRVGGCIVEVAVGRQQGRTCAVALGKRGTGGFERSDTRVGVSEEAKARSMIKASCVVCGTFSA